MADISTPSLILFVASIVVAAGVAGVLIDSVSDVSSAIDERGGDVSQQIQTDVEVISDPGSPVYQNGNLTLLVENTGSRTIPDDPAAIDVIVDGRYQTNVSISVYESTDWIPTSVAAVTVETSLASGDHRVKVVVRGDEELFRFRS